MKEKHVVLFVDDEVSVLSSLRRALMDEDFRCVFASSGEEALRIMEKETVSVIVSDMRMPKMNGLTLLKRVTELYPNTVRIILSGYTQLQQVLTTINQVNIFKFIPKPWKLEEEFIPIIYQAIDYYKMQVERIQLRESLKAKNIAYKNILNTMQTKLSTDVVNYDNIGRVFICFTEFVYLKNNIPISEEDFIKAKKMFLSFLKIFPDNISEFKLQDLIKHIEKQLLEMNENNTVHIQKDFFNSDTYYFNINKILFAVNTILELTLSQSESYFIELKLRNVDKKDKKLSFEFSIEPNSIVKGFEHYKGQLEFKVLVDQIFEILDISTDISINKNKMIFGLEGVF